VSIAMNGDGDTKKSVIFFATDIGFALPTIASALEIRRLCPLHLADIRIVAIELDSQTVNRIRNHLEPAGIFVDTMPEAMFADFDASQYNPTHVPRATLARFFLLDCIPDIYDRMLYLDGDTWPTGDISKLLTIHLPAGKFAAAEDGLYFRRNERGRTGREVRAYFAGLGLDGESGYFNAGVLLSSTQTWREISRTAFAFFQANTASCFYHDQSALNAVSAGRRLRLHSKWNFMSVFDEWGIQAPSPPCIRHFAGVGKPWLFPDHPFASRFETALLQLTGLNLNIKRFSPQRLQAELRFQKRQQIKNQTVFRRRLRQRRKIFYALHDGPTIGA